MSPTEKELHSFVMNNGRHKGTRLVHIPVSYLKWMVQASHKDAEWAEAELKRRGTVTPDLDISGHAIDRASLRCRKIWHQDRNKDEGIHAWLVRVCTEALADGDRLEGGKIQHKGMKFIFDFEGKWPVLKSINLGKRKFATTRFREIPDYESEYDFMKFSDSIRHAPYTGDFDPCLVF